MTSPTIPQQPMQQQPAAPQPSMQPQSPAPQRQPISWEAFAGAVKKAHPEYADVPDEKLTEAMLNKFPQYKGVVETVEQRNQKHVAVLAQKLNTQPLLHMGAMQSAAAASPQWMTNGAQKFTENAPMIAGGAGAVLGGVAGAAGGGMLGSAMKQSALGTGNMMTNNIDPATLLKDTATQAALEGAGRVIAAPLKFAAKIGLPEKAMRFALSGTEDLTKETNPAALLNKWQMKAATRQQLFDQVAKKVDGYHAIGESLLKKALPESTTVNTRAVIDTVIDKNIDAARKSLDEKAVQALEAMKKTATAAYNRGEAGSAAVQDIQAATNIKRVFGKAANWRPGPISTEFQAAHDLVQSTRRQIYGALNDAIKGAIKTPGLAKAVAENNQTIREGLEAMDTLQAAADEEKNHLNYHLWTKMANTARVPVGTHAAAAARTAVASAPVASVASKVLPQAARAAVVANSSSQSQ